MYKGSDIVLDLLIKRSRTIEELAQLSSLNVDSIRRIIESLREEGYVTIDTRESVVGSPTAELVQYSSSTFPEVSVFQKAVSGASITDLSPVEKSIGIRWAKVKGLVKVEAGKLVPAKTQNEVDQLVTKLTHCSTELKNNGNSSDLELVEEFFERHLLDKKTIRSTTISYTGKKIDPSVFSDGFDINVPGKNASLGKNHPITQITKKIKTIMTEMGFEEMEGDLVESSFWNFDALFQPQDHPARELADTFYVKGECPLPSDKALIERVKAAHEKGWKYQWDPKEASKAVLRTHTTALSARYVAANKEKKPKKFFSIGRVFRNEATDYKHLAEFHQVEGIIIWENATFTDLLGVLKEFYRKLGFENIRFRPSFFPYTEPSLEIEVYFEKKKQWLELGGAGIFRPEVSIPLVGVYPVLAWGLSLERPLMLLLELEDIRTFYKNDVDFLTSSRLDI
ncbi:Phenylalanine--tRNA ligase alpha subunit [Candidatus Bilamarchaeum dharawalense]|uniref:phenylalanine--tRNA ligase n=1 Tax=Candidatus Bilamarchaeum dharawalense TaxID=2885759 RepID=A0A5E4LWF9_9ARCH|nr:Phenylalanine--tRNA ligase alpha subunit [Candidatus Bilamarchaeum dharawalense]